MRVDIWSDVTCPWCYIGKRRFERALENFPYVDAVDVVHRAFQLDPFAPEGVVISRREYLMKKFGWSVEQAQQMDRRMEATAAGDGLEYNLEGGIVGNTLDAHRLLVLAADLELQGDILVRFYRAQFTERRSLFDHESLIRLAEEAGQSAVVSRRTLDSDDGRKEVAADLSEARSLGITGVPYFLFDGQFALSGAQPRDVFAEALTRIWDQAQGKPS